MKDNTLLNNEESNLLSVKEASVLLGYSRVHVVRLINNGDIPAKKIGRSYVIDRASLGGVFGNISKKNERKVEEATEKVLEEYGPALRKLGKE